MKHLYEFLVKRHTEKSVEDFVDLGLPSGTLWCTHNLGAESQEEYGQYFQWGSIKGYSLNDKHSFDWENYPFGNEFNIYKYNEHDKKIHLDLADDAAYQYDNRFCIPTKTQFKELEKNTYQEEREINGIKGICFISKKNDKEIFIPYSGYRDDSTAETGTTIDLWTSNLLKDNCTNATCFVLWEVSSSMETYSDRSYGLAIRPVIRK